MNNLAKMLLAKHMEDKRENNYNLNIRRDHNDERRGVKGTGPYSRMRDRGDYADNRDYGDRRDYDNRDYADNRDYNYDRRDYGDRRDYNYDNRDYRDYAEHMYKLSQHDMHDWKSHMMNADGTKGPRFTVSEIMDAADKLGIRPHNYTEDEFCMAANMLYSDFGMDFKNLITPDREAIEYAKMARSFMEDKDASAKGSEKLAIYYYCIVKK